MTGAVLADELLDDVHVVEHVAHLVRVGLEAWVDDARQWYWQTGPEHPGFRSETAWHLICSRPARVPLVDVAAALAGCDPAEVWAMLRDRVIEP